MAQTFDRRLTPARPDLAAEHLRGVVEAARYVAGVPMRVADELAPLYTAPSRESSIDTQALFGETVVVYERDVEGWDWVQLAHDGYVGYTLSESLRADAPKPSHRVAATRSFVYSARTIKAPPLMALPQGALVSATKVDGDFVAIAPWGFVFAAHLSEVDAQEPDFVAVAERYRNAPYLWGGKTWCGLDCSGLVQIALHAAGVSSPRDTDMMRAALGADIPFDDALEGLRRGDLVFWKGHIGVMQDATRLLHANGHHMSVASEPLVQARDRILAKSFGPITAIKRLSL